MTPPAGRRDHITFPYSQRSCSTGIRPAKRQARRTARCLWAYGKAPATLINRARSAGPVRDWDYGCRPKLHAFPPASPVRFSCHFSCTFLDDPAGLKSAARGRFFALHGFKSIPADSCMLGGCFRQVAAMPILIVRKRLRIRHGALVQRLILPSRWLDSDMDLRGSHQALRIVSLGASRRGTAVSEVRHCSQEVSQKEVRVFCQMARIAIPGHPKTARENPNIPNIGSFLLVWTLTFTLIST